MGFNEATISWINAGIPVNLLDEFLWMNVLVQRDGMRKPDGIQASPCAAPLGMVIPGVFPSWFSPVLTMTARMESLSRIA